MRPLHVVAPGIFQSTSPVRGTTGLFKQGITSVRISIHVPREGDDHRRLQGLDGTWQFQSTSPVRGTTILHVCGVSQHNISIHVPREGDDIDIQKTSQKPMHFNPRPP